MNRALVSLLLLSVPAWCVAERPFLDGEQAEFLNALQERPIRFRAQAQDPLYTGLPDTIPRDMPEREGFVRFAHIDGDVPPIGGRIRFSVPGLKLMDVFEDESWARLPDGQSVARDTSGPREIWDYPVGTRVMHRLLLKSDPRRLFELRLVQKLPDGKWAFGLYREEPGAANLPLHRDGMPPLSFEVEIKGQLVRVDMFRLSPASCRTCHFRMGHGGYQSPAVDHAGPCGFSPPNPRLLTDWARDYRARHGHEPFRLRDPARGTSKNARPAPLPRRRLKT